jgi:polysaccharide biosynthesis protein PslG
MSARATLALAMGRPHPWGRFEWLAAGLVVLAIAAVVIVLVVSSSPTSVPPPATTPVPLPARPAPTGIDFGASINRLFNDGTWTPEQIATQLKALSETGATEARSDALWEASEPEPPSGGVHHYDWLFDDTIAGDLAAVGLRWLPILDYSAPWAESVAGQDHSPPSSNDDYAAYGQAFAARYGAGGTFWRTHPSLHAEPVTTIEVWNEPDDGDSWYPAPNAGDYATLYQLTRQAIDRVDPTAHVIIGGLVFPESFLPAMVRADPGLVGHIDGVAIHPYGSPDVVMQRVTNARRTLDALGMPGVPLYVTEFGWTVSPMGAPDFATAAQRPGLLQTTLDRLGHSDCGIAAAMVYTWATPEQDPNESEDWFGISPVGPSSDTVALDPQATAGFIAGLREARAPGATGTSCQR